MVSWVESGMSVRVSAAVVSAVLTVFGMTSAPSAAAADPCGTGSTPTVCENSKPGADPSEWDVEGAGDSTIQGFPTTTSVTPGQTVRFKIKAQTAFSVDVYRLGYYQGLGARRQAARWTVTNPPSQPVCATDPSTHNYDCGTWSVTTQWAVPSDSVSGVYIAKLSMGTDYSQIPFVVRGDGTSDVIFKTSDATWQAYNAYGGSDFYTAPSSLTGTQARAFKISYNRPYLTRGAQNGRDYLFSNEYPTLRFLERNGIDVSYTTDVDVSTGTSVLTGHSAFLSVGHDEYWTKPERDAVEAARDAGVDLMFLSGNEAYWHARLEPSIDGTSTANRTLVCYKDSWESSKIDPGEGSPTWRDASQAAPNGSRPENALTGTMYMANDTDLAIQVSAAQGKSRLWRHTTLATMAPGASATLAPHSIGYESDEDVDNGHRPAGLMRLSETTGPTAQRVVNQAGTSVEPGTTTHSLTLYRAASGALVFGAGTISWGWGLDQAHDGDNTNPPDSRMQQATLNMLSDMGATPATLMPGMVQPSAAADLQAPAVSITSPAAGAQLANGSVVNVTGTAAESGGGVVTVVEVSLDGGATYHRATGTVSWSYSGVVPGVGATSIKVRASDDSANLSAPVSRPVTVSCPCSLFGQEAPATPTTNDTSAVELGVKFSADSDGYVGGIRFYKGTGNNGTHTGTLWTLAGQPIAAGTFTGESSSGWQTLTFPEPVAITGNTTYVASYFAPTGRYAADLGFFRAEDHLAVPLTAPGAPSGLLNGVFGEGHGFPTQSYGNTNYWVDLLYSRDDTTPPTVARTSPVSSASSVSPSTKPSATFATTVDPASVQLLLRDAGGNVVTGTTAFTASTRTAVFTPSANLSYGAVYTASVTASSTAGVPMPAPHTWSFTVSLTDPLPGICPCTIWPDTATPAVASTNDTGNVELGARWTADTDGQVTAVRFYKGPLNLGTHTGNLWTAAGGLLATVTFSGESSTGWQTAYFTAPVDVTAGTTYIVSYRAPSGGYAVTSNGLLNSIDSTPLHTVARGAVYTYGSGAPLTASNDNYWVDLVFMASDAAPSVARTSPSDTATNVNPGATVSATLNGLVQADTATLVLKDSGGATVQATTAWSAATRTISLNPDAPLAEGSTYTATVSGARALSGSVMSPYTFSFGIAGIGACPCTLFDSSALPGTPDSGDPGTVEVGVSFTPATDGQVTGVRFYKSVLNTGTHTGSLWTSAGQLLATGTFTGESTSGWQTLTFPGAVAVTGGTTYVASYFAPNGHYAAQSQFFASPWTNGPLAAGTTNGLYRYGSGGGFPTGTYGSTNYWVDPIFGTGTPPDTIAPTVLSVTPLASSTSQPAATPVSATFSEAVVSASLSFTLTSQGGPAVTGATTYDGATRTATFTPSTALTRGTTFVAAVTASDAAGNAMAAPRTWTFTVAQPDPAPGVCPCGLWTDATQPTSMTDPDQVAVELGTAFSADTNGSVTGVRFYKGPENTGTHTVSLWATDGTRLATATPTGESSTGWQTATFSSPVAITVGTTYVASYLAPNGKYSATPGAQSAPRDVAPLHTAATAGRYVYGPGYPANVSGASYLVDPVFVTGAPPVDTTPPAISGVAVTTSGSTATVTWSTDESATSIVSWGPTASLGSTATGATGTSHSVTITGLSSATAYHYRVTSADTAANESTSPAAAEAPSTFTSADTVAPAVSAVAVSGTATNRTISWTTDESSTTSIAYGTSPAALTSTSTGAIGTSHSVGLTGLAEGTTYYYRVTSADEAGNSTTSPATTDAPASFAVDDLTAPAVSAVAVSGTGTIRTITWTTDETSTTSVAYGTTASALTSTAAGASGTSHSVGVTGLAESTTYYYRVTSSDPSGNSTTSPAASGAPATFTIGDLTAPVVSAVAATGSGTTAVVTWTTNESSTSSVAFGTTATSLTSTSTGTSGTSHSVTLSGLTQNTRYYYRVTSADASGNTSTSPAATAAAAAYVPTVAPIVRTTVADFSTGSGGYVADTSGGEVIATPTAGYELAGTSLPSGLTSTALVSGGSTAVANNVAAVSGARLATSSYFATGTSFSTKATLLAGHIVGWASSTGGQSGVRAAFVMGASGVVSVVSNDGRTVNATSALTGTFTGAHEWRIDWTNTQVVYYVDGVQVAAVGFVPTSGSTLRPTFVDPTNDTNRLVVDWVRRGTYAASSTFTSAVINAGAVVGWDLLTRDVTTPGGTTVTIQVRSGNSASTGGSSWTGWSTVSATTGSITRSARYIQYQVISTTSGSRFVSPETKGVTLTFHVL